MAENFDAKADDELYRWSDRRSGYLAKANVSSANSLVGGSSGSGSVDFRDWAAVAGELSVMALVLVWAMV